MGRAIQRSCTKWGQKTRVLPRLNFSCMCLGTKRLASHGAPLPSKSMALAYIAMCSSTQIRIGGERPMKRYVWGKTEYFSEHQIYRQAKQLYPWSWVTFSERHLRVWQRSKGRTLIYSMSPIEFGYEISLEPIGVIAKSGMKQPRKLLYLSH